MFTNETDYQKFDRDTSFGHMFKRFASIATGVGVITGAYMMLFNNDLPAKAREISETPAVMEAAGDTLPQDGMIEQGTEIIGDIITRALMASQTAAVNNNALLNDPNAAAQPAMIAPAVTALPQDDGYDHSFYDLTFQNVKNAQGEIIGQINDVLVNPATGQTQYIVYTKKRPGETDTTPLYYVFGTMDIMMTEQDGDIQLKERGDLQSINHFTYNDEVFNRFISLKTLRQGYVTDSFNKTVGEIQALIYRNNMLEDIIILLDDSFAIGENRLFHMSFDQANIISVQNGYTLQMDESQTTNIAEYLYE